MRIVDRYVLRTFGKVFVICFLSISGIYIVGDFVGNLSEFVDHAGDRENLWVVMGTFYGARLPWFFDLTSRVVALIASVFVITWLQRHNELTSLMAAGVSRLRVIAPLIAATLAVSLLAAVNREVGIPRVRYHLCRKSRDWVGDGGRAVRPMFDNKTGIWISGAKTYSQQRRISSPNFRLPPELQSFGRRIVAANAFYRDAAKDRPGGYLMTRVTQPANLADTPSAKMDQKKFILSPKDTRWLKPGECFVVSDVTLEHLESGLDWYRFSSTAELLRGLRKPSLDLASDARILIHARLIQPLLDMTLLFVGLPIILARDSRNVFVAIGLCILVVIGFFAVVIAFQALGMNYLISPALAAWSPLMVFLPLAVGLSEPLRR